MFYSGIDLHKDMSFITTLNDEGIIVKQEKMPIPTLRDYFTIFFLNWQGA